MQLSVVIRAKDEAAGIRRVLELLAAQDIAEDLQAIVVDSGSSDETVEIARAFGAEVVEIPSASFTFGYALNVGCERALAPLIVALSAHAYPPDAGWATRMVNAMSDDSVACACGYDTGPDGGRLTERTVHDEAHLNRFPLWGYSNANGIFRRELWCTRPFREDMPGTEDKEWAAYWIARGRVSVVDPNLAVIHSHHGDGPRLTYERSRREWEGNAMFLRLPEYPISAMLAEWWAVEAPERRIGWRRNTGLLGKWAGLRRGRSRWTPSRPEQA
jgi:rhamnosyltransferase